MHVTMTQGVVRVDVSMTRDEAMRLKTILNYSDQLWQRSNVPLPEKLEKDIEKTSLALFTALSKAGVETLA